MYQEGEEKYLKDLDCVNIVKSIRELKALTRIILNQHQREILAFEHESVIPSSKYLKEQNTNEIQNKVPFEYDNQEKHQKYSEELDKFINQYSNRQLSKIDKNIINDIVFEAAQPIQDVSASNNSMIDNLVTEQYNKWE